MQKRWGVFAAVLAAIVVAAPSVRAQDVEVKVRVPEDVVRQAQQLIDSLTGTEMQRDIREAIHDATASIGAITGREVRDALRDAARELSHANTMGWSTGQSRNFRSTATDKQTKTFQLGNNGQLSLDNVLGDIHVTAGSGRDVVVEILRQSRGATDADAKLGLEHVIAETTDHNGRASVKTDYPNAPHKTYDVTVTYTVTAPAGTQISAHSVAGDITVSGIHGELSAATISGDVHIDHAGRVTEARATAGDVTLTAIDSDGTVEVSTTSGKVTATQIKARRLDIGTVSDSVVVHDAMCDAIDAHSLAGDIIITGAIAPRARYKLTTHSGDVRLTTDGRTGFDFDGSSFSGSMRSDFPLQTAAQATRSRRNLHGTFGDGSASITVVTFSGDVTLTKK